MEFHLAYLNKKPTCQRSSYLKRSIKTGTRQRLQLMSFIKNIQRACILTNMCHSAKRSLQNSSMLYLIACTSWCHACRTILFLKLISNRSYSQRSLGQTSAILLHLANTWHHQQLLRIQKRSRSLQTKLMTHRERSLTQILSLIKGYLLQRMLQEVAIFIKNLR